MSNGKLVYGQYSRNEGVLFNLSGIVNYGNLVQNDIVMFTYWGTGKFDVVVFDKNRVEKAITEDVVDNCKI